MDQTPVVDDLIYDVGLHRGQDTAFYLRLGYRVVAFEANPRLIEHNRRRFAAELDDGRLTIVEGAITGGDEEAVTFYVHAEHDELSTIDSTWVERNVAAGQSRPITVPAVDFAAQIRATGVPYFMKVDIEGADEVCFRALLEFANRPKYVSLESSKVSWDALCAEFGMLERLGYNRFAVVQQAPARTWRVRATDRSGNPVHHEFETGASGPFGEQVGPWLNRKSALRRYRGVYTMYRLFGDHSWIRRTRLGYRAVTKLSGYLPFALPGWYDTHAMRDSPR
jgi:FkbM family methyltransferase